MFWVHKLNLKEVTNNIYLLRLTKYLVIYTFLLIMLVMMVGIVLWQGSYDLYYDSKGVIVRDDDNYYIKLAVGLDDLNKVTNNNLLFINNHPYQYQVEIISDNLYVDNMYLYNYKEVWLYSDLPKDKLILNNVVDLKIKYQTVKLITMLVNLMLGKED